MSDRRVRSDGGKISNDVTVSGAELNNKLMAPSLTYLIWKFKYEWRRKNSKEIKLNAFEDNSEPQDYGVGGNVKF